MAGNKRMTYHFEIDDASANRAHRLLDDALNGWRKKKQHLNYNNATRLQRIAI